MLGAPSHGWHANTAKRLGGAYLRPRLEIISNTNIQLAHVVRHNLCGSAVSLGTATITAHNLRGIVELKPKICKKPLQPLKI